jgi:hypothetical protein
LAGTREKNMNEDISNVSVYNASMKKSLLDKIFFMDKIDAGIFVDYGCADGALIKFLHTLFPEYQYYGFDISEEMISLARKANSDIADNFTSDWEEIKDKIFEEHQSGTKTVLILSSIIHEVYSYGTASDVSDVWQRTFHEDFDFIVLRDMMPSRTVERQADINDIVKVNKNKKFRAHLVDFETFWGSIENNKNLVHYFLKYRYYENWEREVRENYIPVSREQFFLNITDEYDVIFHEHFILPFLKNKVMEDFGIELKDNTHLKLILKKKET